ncbi:hypothetical protein ABZ154_09325 [Streptomyces sp. NPDC006261]|uniref:hypothetical protein n=1 Tax=Streptomyces sp. NPDC006261 TaxID=3156739 RepID=UPI0033A8AC9F
MTAARKTAATKPVEKTEDETPKVSTFEYKGQTYSVPADPLDLPLEVGLAESEFEIVQEILGDEQWIEFRKTKPSIRNFGDFSEKLFEACGYGDAGN